MRVVAAAIGLVALVLCAFLAAAALGAGAHAKPDLYVVAAKATSTPAAATGTVANRGPGCAPASKTSFFASTDAKQSRGDKLVVRKATRRLCKKTKQAITVKVDLAALPSGL